MLIYIVKLKYYTRKSSNFIEKMDTTKPNNKENIILTCHFYVIPSVFEIFYPIIRNIYDNLIAIQKENGSLNLEDVIKTICTWVFYNVGILKDENIPPTKIQSFIDMWDTMFRMFVEENLNSSYNPSEVNHQLYGMYDKNKIIINETTTFDKICKMILEQFDKLNNKTVQFEDQQFEINEYEPEYYIPTYSKYDIDSVRESFE